MAQMRIDDRFPINISIALVLPIRQFICSRSIILSDVNLVQVPPPNFQLKASIPPRRISVQKIGLLFDRILPKRSCILIANNSTARLVFSVFTLSINNINNSNFVFLRFSIK